MEGDPSLVKLLYDVACLAAAKCIAVFYVNSRELVTMITPYLNDWSANKSDALCQGLMSALGNDDVITVAIQEWADQLPEPQIIKGMLVKSDSDHSDWLIDTVNTMWKLIEVDENCTLLM